MQRKYFKTVVMKGHVGLIFKFRVKKQVNVDAGITNCYNPTSCISSFASVTVLCDGDLGLPWFRQPLQHTTKLVLPHIYRMGSGESST